MHMRRQEEVNNNNPDTEWSLNVDDQPEGYGVPLMRVTTDFSELMAGSVAWWP